MPRRQLLTDTYCPLKRGDKAYLLESTLSNETVRVVFRSSGPSDVVSVIVGLSDFLFLFIPELHTVVKDENVDRSTLSLVPDLVSHCDSAP